MLHVGIEFDAERRPCKLTSGAHHAFRLEEEPGDVWNVYEATAGTAVSLHGPCDLMGAYKRLGRLAQPHEADPAGRDWWASPLGDLGDLVRA